MFLKMVHPHFVYIFTIIVVLKLNTTLSLKAKKELNVSASCSSHHRLTTMKIKNNCSNITPFSSFFTFSLMMAGLAHNVTVFDL
jgi:hypothetical protein